MGRRISRLLTHELRGRQPLILYASGPHFRQTNAIEGQIGEGTGGVTEAYKRRIILPMAGPLQATDHVLGHELVHAFQYDITGTNVSSNTAGALALPLWFIEGMAEYLSIGPLIRIRQCGCARRPGGSGCHRSRSSTTRATSPIATARRSGRSSAGADGDRAVASLLRAGAVARDPEEAFKAVLGVDEKELSKLWHEAEFAAYKPIAEITKMPVPSRVRSSTVRPPVGT